MGFTHACFLDLKVMLDKVEMHDIMGGEKKEGRERTCFKELAHTIMEVGKFKVKLRRAGRQAGGLWEEWVLQVKSTGSLEAEFPIKSFSTKAFS